MSEYLKKLEDECEDEEKYYCFNCGEYAFQTADGYCSECLFIGQTLDIHGIFS